MKAVILTKQHACIQLGHLYEHLFLMRLKKFFYEHRLYKSLDVAFWGTTYEQGGVIEVVCELYSKEAQKLADEIAKLTIEFGEDNLFVTNQLHAIAAEEPTQLYISDKDQLLADLRALDASRWTPVDELEYIDTKSYRRKNSPIYLTDQPVETPGKVHVQLSVNTDFLATNREFAPMFNVIGRWLLLTATDQVTTSRGYFAGEPHGNDKPLSITSEWHVAKYANIRVDVAKDHELAMQVMRHITTKRVINRYAQELKDISFSHIAELAPDTERLLMQTGVYMGERGWKHVATSDNIEKLLANIELKITYGRSSVKTPVSL